MREPSEIEEAVRNRYAAAAKTASACCSVPDCLVLMAARFTALHATTSATSTACPRRRWRRASAAPTRSPSPTFTRASRVGPRSGGGIDVLLSARRVGPTGKAYGVDMTDEMLELAHANQQRAGVTNAEFLRGRDRGRPASRRAVDVIVSNCVINLSPTSPRCSPRPSRLLRPGGRLAVADVVADSRVDASRRSRPRSLDRLHRRRRHPRRVPVNASKTARIHRHPIEDSHAVADGFTSVIVRAASPL